MKQDYKKLLEICLMHTDNLIVLLDKNYHIENISTMVTKLLGWEKDKVINKFINDVCRENLTEPFFKAADPNSQDVIDTYIFEEEQDIKISWRSFIADNNTLLIGTRSSEKHSQERANFTDELNLQELIIHPVLDVDKALRSFNQDRTLVHGVFKSMVEEEIPSDLNLIAAARAKNDWEEVSALVHKMKGGAMYCGTTKLQHACLYFETCKKTGDIKQLNWMLEQLLVVCTETQNKIKDWLADKKEFFK